MKSTRSSHLGERWAAIPIILGPTATGKSALAYQLALRLPAEIISADSRNFYRGLDVGTAKPPPEWCAAVPHHLIDIREPEAPYNAMDFRRDVERLLPQIRARGRRPLIVGGSTLYLYALTEGIFSGPTADPERRRALYQAPLEALYERLKVIDAEAAGRIHPHDRRRIVRALEVYEQTGRPISAWQRARNPLSERFFKIGLHMERQLLYKCIEERIEKQLAQGLLAEARMLQRRLRPGMPVYDTLGYRQFFQYLEGRSSLSEAMAQIKHRTRQYAKRQLIWFRRDREIHWIDVTDKALDGIVSEALALIRQADDSF